MFLIPKLISRYGINNELGVELECGSSFDPITIRWNFGFFFFFSFFLSSPFFLFFFIFPPCLTFLPYNLPKRLILIGNVSTIGSRISKAYIARIRSIRENTSTASCSSLLAASSNFLMGVD